MGVSVKLNTALKLTLLLWIGLTAGARIEGKSYSITASDGVKLHVEVAGKGGACIFVQAGQGSMSFREMGIKALEKHFTMIYMDRRGSGRSASASDYSLDRMASDLDEIREHLGYPKITVLAHSLGGVIALRYARNYPDHISHLIMANVTLHLLNDAMLREQIKFLSPEHSDYLGSLQAIKGDELRKLARHVRSDSAIGYRILTDNLRTIKKMNRLYERSAGNQDFTKLLTAEPSTLSEYYADYSEDTRLIKIPTLLIAGTRDYAVGVNHHLRFRFPNHFLKVIPGGHLPYADDREAFVESITGFLGSGPVPQVRTSKSWGKGTKK
ncbi:MAG: alpha/beta fold hydrolase [Pyrinomonadaceae bacterium]